VTLIWHDHEKSKRLIRSQPLQIPRWLENLRDLGILLISLPVIVLVGIFLLFVVKEPNPPDVSYEDYS